MQKTKIVLIAGLKNGRYIAEYFKNEKNTELARCYVLKDEKGKNVSDFLLFDDIVDAGRLTKVNNINDFEEEISIINPDYIFVVGWSQLISDKIIKSAKKGAIGFHPAKLPKDRGRSALAWQIAEGYKSGCVSMFFIDNGVDSGDIIGQEEYAIRYDDTIRNVLDNTYKICLNLTETYYPLLRKGLIEPVKQEAAKATYRRLRTQKDGVIDWNKTSYEIYNLIRAITLPYPGAVTCANGEVITVLSAEEVPLENDYSGCENGTIVEMRLDKGIVVKTRGNGILIKEIFIDGETVNISHLKDKFHLGDILR